ncbi:hypothetical protein P3T73_04515 [Kiritimatiellota bacterium B12222]|nr:hypothetical protein P3T73_04515 [Kiritimatiellota bacterium B12222]
MKKTLLLLALMMMLFGSGCATRPTAGQNAEFKIFSLKVNSTPPGARLVTPEGVEEWEGITTPGDLKFQFMKRAGDNFMGKMGLTSWQVELSADHPWIVTENDDAYTFRTPELILEKEGYAAQPFHYSWRIPKDFQNRDAEGKKMGEVSPFRSLNVVMQNPTQPESLRKIKITSASGPIDIYAMGPDGQPGVKIGTTPFMNTLGVGAVRAADGQILDWKIWDLNQSNVWSVTKGGVILFSGFLMCENYKPEKVMNFQVMTLEPEQAEDFGFGLQMTTPSVPQAEFTLHVDTLPSKSSIFIYNDDNTLGEQLGNAPVQLTIGLAQQLSRFPDGVYEHKDWILWDPSGLFRLRDNEAGNTEVLFRSAFYLDGFSPEQVTRSLIELIPGKAFPATRVLNIPLYKPEHAAIREAQKLGNQKAEPKAEVEPARPAFIWKAP